MNRRGALISLATGLSCVLVIAGALVVRGPAGSQPAAKAPTLSVDFSELELARILQHGPWPVAPVRDPSNRASGRREAIGFGKALFFEPRLSGNGKSSCATCHLPELHFADGKKRGERFIIRRPHRTGWTARGWWQAGPPLQRMSMPCLRP